MRRLIKGSNILMFNMLWKSKPQKVVTHTMSYLFALSLYDFSLFPRQAKPASGRLHCSLLVVTRERKIHSDLSGIAVI